MNITFFIGGLSGGGAERVTCNLANYMIEKGHHVEILTMADDEPSYPLSQGINRKSLLQDSERRNFAYNSALRFVRFIKYLRATTAEATIVMLPVTTIMLLWMKQWQKGKVIAAERSLPTVYTSKEQWQLKKIAHRADGWVFQTKEQQDWYKDSNIRRGVIIPNAINPIFIKPVYNGVRNKHIVTVGSLTKPKNHELLIKSFAKISDQFPEYQLVIYGTGSKLESLRSFAKDFNVLDRVVFPGYTKQVDRVIADASLFVLSSDYEGMPNALMEAMALGLPCISTDCDGGGAKFLIKNEKNGLIVPKGDVEALSAAMERMLSDREFAKQCGQEAHKICERLAPEKVYGEWESFIKEIVNSK